MKSVFLALCLTGALLGQTSAPDALARAFDSATLRTVAGSTSGEIPLVLDPAVGGQDYIVLDYTDQSLSFSLIRPDGFEVTTANAASLGFEFTTLMNPAGSNSITSIGTAQLWIQLPTTTPPGAYKVRINAAAAISPSLVFAALHSSSSVRVATLANPGRIRAGDTLKIATAVFDGTVPLQGATIQATIFTDVLAPLVTLSGFTLTSQTTLPDSRVKYTLRATATNGGSAATAVRALAAGDAPAGFVFESGALFFGDLAAGGSIQSEPTLVLVGPAGGVPSLLGLTWRVVQTLAPVTLSLSDSGAADTAPGDGTYTASFTPTIAGEYSVGVRVTGVSGSGLQFSRASTTSFIVTNHGQVGAITDQLIDDNGNGKADRLALTAQVNVQVPGSYTLKGQLVAANGNVIDALTSANLGAGNQPVTISFPASELSSLSLDGPFSRRNVMLVFNEPGNSLIADSRDDAGPSSAVTLANLDLGTAYFAPPYAAAGVTTGLPGVFDVLRIQVGAVSTGGDCNWTGVLSTSSGEELDTASGTGTLPSGLSSLQLDFSGILIAQAGQNGPYRLKALELVCPASSAIADNVFDTPAFNVAQFRFVAPGISLSVQNAAVVRGFATTTPVTVAGLGEYTGAVSLSFAGAPAGLSITAQDLLSAVPGTNTLNISTTNAVNLGTYPITITGTSGVYSASAVLSVNVVAPDFAIGVTPAAQALAPGGRGSANARE